METRFFLTYVHTDSELPGNLTKEELRNHPDRAQRNAFAKQFDYIDSDWQRNFELFRIANRTTWNLAKTSNSRFPASMPTKIWTTRSSL
ncbi:hypothetical protein [Verrucomicrobium spinosum]|uniref:hypothetical protein n=1 Tax=Verrucomicrobium spinosum TaxID=2736 RepID=UPI0009EBBE7A|nr:hypothetical protein [Verrucomicrobium spinosum]